MTRWDLYNVKSDGSWKYLYLVISTENRSASVTNFYITPLTGAHQKATNYQIDRAIDLLAGDVDGNNTTTLWFWTIGDQRRAAIHGGLCSSAKPSHFDFSMQHALLWHKSRSHPPFFYSLSYASFFNSLSYASTSKYPLMYNFE